MRNNLFIILCICCFSTSLFSQKKYLKNYTNEGVLKEEGWVDNEQKLGYWKFYYTNGKIKKQGGFIDNCPVKYWYFYRENGTLEKEGHYLNGKQNKWWLFYDEEGNVNHKCQLKDDLKNGYCLLYEKNKLVKALRFNNNKKVNEWTDFSSFKKENDLKDLK